jgi:dUTPase
MAQMLPVTCSNFSNILRPAKNGDVGFDLIASSDPKIVGERTGEDSPYYESIDYIEYEVDLKIEPPKDFFSLVFPRSSISKYNLQLCNSVGVIDNGYRGKILVRFNYLWQPKDVTKFKYIKHNEPEFIYEHYVTEVDFEKIDKKGDKIAQLVFSQSFIPSLVVGQVGETERGAGCFGSTGI